MNVRWMAVLTGFLVDLLISWLLALLMAPIVGSDFFTSPDLTRSGDVILIILLTLATGVGGYVAGRMARFNGAKQGFMVWIWALIAAVLVAVLGMIAGEQFNILAQLNSFPRIPVNEGQVTTTGIIAAVVVALVALVGAVLGGMAGMHFHRKVDRAGFTPTADYEER